MNIIIWIGQYTIDQQQQLRGDSKLLKNQTCHVGLFCKTCGYGGDDKTCGYGGDDKITIPSDGETESR